MSHKVKRTATVKKLDSQSTIDNATEVSAIGRAWEPRTRWSSRPGEEIPGIGTIVSVTYEWEDDSE